MGKGAADAAILLPPVTVEQIRAAALAGVRMPQKTTYFAPKPRSGLVYRPLAEISAAQRGVQANSVRLPLGSASLRSIVNCSSSSFSKTSMR